MRVHIHCLGQPLVESVNGPGRCRVKGPGATVVALTGDLDAPAVPEFETGVDAAMAGAVRTLILDLSHVGFVAISGVQAVLAVQDRADCKGVALLVVADGWESHPAVKAAGMANRLRCFPSLREAVEARRAELVAHVDLDYVIGR